MHLSRFAILALLTVPFARLLAQDVTVTSLAWSELRDPPQELPRLKDSPSVRFPAEMKQTTDYGYVVYEVLLDGKGQPLGMRPYATLAIYERASHGEAAPRGEHLWTWNPGRRDGKGVNTATTFAYIFNPMAAADKIPDAAPRLLDVALVRISSPKGQKPPVVVDPRVEMADMSVDEHGNVTAVRNAPAGLEDAFTVAARNWRFAPARQAGKAVAAEVRAPFIVVTDNENPPGGKATQPRVTKQIPPTYPFAMQASGMRGEVVVDFIVDIEGRVRNAYVARSLNPSFDDPALEAVRQWTFEPGRVGERPVNTHMQVPVFFTLNEQAGGGRNPMTEERKRDLSKLPEQFRYDTPPRPTGTVRPVYPYELLRTKKEGKAVVRYIVDQNGRVAQTSIGDSAAPELARALQAAVELFVFEPALKAGKPCLAMQGYSQIFNRDASWMLIADEDVALLRREEKKPETILGQRDLDKKLTPLSRRPPRFPLSVKETTKSGEAVVEFLVDEDGRARLPRVISASEEPFGYAAVQSVASWRFEPPTRGGRPAVVRVQAPIVFNLSAAPAGKE